MGSPWAVKSWTGPRSPKTAEPALVDNHPAALVKRPAGGSEGTKASRRLDEVRRERSGLSKPAAMSTAAADALPVEPQSLKKLSLKSLKRSLDLFAPAHSLLFAPDAER
jgi:hypothetical protein